MCFRTDFLRNEETTCIYTVMNNTHRNTRGKLTVKRIVELYNAGMSTRAIAVLHKTNRSSICAILRRRRHLLSKKRRAGKFAKGQRIKGKLTAEEIVKVYTSSAISVAKLAILDGTTPAIILRLLRRAKCVIKKPSFFEKHGMNSRAKAFKIPSQTYMRLRAIVRLGGKCIICGASDFRLLQLNHIKGKEHPPTYSEYLNIIENGSDLHDVRCANCNLLYEFERGRRSYPAALIQELIRDRDAQQQACPPALSQSIDEH